MNQFNWAEVANQLNKEGRIKWVDQDVINIVLDGEIVLLDLNLNFYNHHLFLLFLLSLNLLIHRC